MLERPNTVAKAARSLGRHETLVGPLYQEGSREGRAPDAVPTEAM